MTVRHYPELDTLFAHAKAANAWVELQALHPYILKLVVRSKRDGTVIAEQDICAGDLGSAAALLSEVLD